MPIADTINRIYREFKRYTGDGLPDEPAGAPLPVGDPQSGPYNPKKSELRAAFGSIATDLDASVSEARAAATDAENAKGLAEGYANAAASASGLGVFSDQASLEADSGLSYADENAVAPGFVVTTRIEGKVFIVASEAAEDQHVVTAGGVKLYDRGVYSSPAIGQAQQVMDRLKRGLAVDILVVSDSTGNGPTRWVYKFGEELGRQTGANVFVRQWDVGIGNYAGPENVWSGSGPVVIIWNYAISGSTAIRGLGADLLPAMVIGTMAGRDFDLCMINYGHNGGDSIGVQLGLEAAAIGVISRLYPFTPMMVIAQNKSLVTTAMREKARAFNHLTTQMNVGYISVHAFFEDYAIPTDDYYIDSVHPTELGSRLWGFCVARAFVYQPDAARSAGRSLLGRGIIKQAQRYSELTSGLLSSGTTVSRQTTAGAWQSDGGSLQITGDGVTAGAYVRWVVIPSADIVMYRGRWITATVFLRIPNGTPPTGCCIVQLTDGVGSAAAPQPLETGAAFVPISVSLKVNAAATDVSLLIFSAFGAANNASFWVDRWNVVDGPIAADPNANANAPEIIVGSNGIAILHPNGDMICRKTVAANAIAITTAWGSLFQSGAIALGNWQQNFLTIDHQSVRAYANDGSLTAPVAEFGSLLTTGPRSVHLWSPVNTVAKDYTITVEGKGRWR